MTPLRQQLLDCMQVRHFSIRTQQAYVRWVYDLAKHTHRSPDTLQDHELKKYLWSLTLERNLSSSTCAQAFHALNFFYGQVLGRTFSEQLLPPMKRQQKIPELLSPQEVKRILSACNNIKYRTLLTLCYGCGLRISEVTNLKVKDIDGEQEVIHVHLAKGSKDRRIALSETLLHVLRVYWQRFRPISYLFCRNYDDRALNISSPQKVYYKAKADAGILKQGGIHALRHAFATHQLMAGMPLPELQHILGHKDIRTTVRYTHWLPHYQAVQGAQFDLLKQLEQQL
jgi:integrase/recombinase XerD